jgi:hypothetical protein
VAFIVPSVPEAPKPAKGKAKTKAAPKDATKKEPVEKIPDLVGRRLGVVGRSPNNIEVLKVILRQYNVSPDKVVILMSEDLAKPNAPDKINIIQYDPNNVAAAIRESNVDAIMSVGPVSSPITADAIAAATRDKEPPKFIALTAAEAIAERNPIYESTEIKAAATSTSRPLPTSPSICSRSARRCPRNCRRPPRSRSPTPTRMPRCRCIPAPPLIWTAS